ncbi:MAG: c-type cytochrome, partial [Planctomycetales bacterium]
PPTAFGHGTTTDAITMKWTQIEQGRLLYENHGCGACHGAAGWKLSARKGPELSDVGSRVTADWLATWLANPRHYRKTSAMPAVLSDAAEIRDVAEYLSKLTESSNKGADSAKNPQRLEAGKEIFDRVGCKKCHGPTGSSLKTVGGKFMSSRALAKYLADPLHVDPSGRMPRMFDPKTQASEAALVADFLFHTKKNADPWSKHPQGGDAQQGRKLVQSRGCVACHSVKEGGKALADAMKPPLFTQRLTSDKNAFVRFDPLKGCLADATSKSTPDYRFPEADRASLRAFLSSIAEHPVVATAPVETFYRRVSQFKCAACHSLDNQNVGPAQEQTEEGLVRKIERPPTLTGIGDKLQTTWIRDVLLKEKRTRPWMNARMPHFGAELESLPDLFPVASGSTLKDESPQPKFELAAAGLETIGVQRGKVSCITCHNYRGINRRKEGVVPAPDMAEIGQTLRRDWFNRWLHNPTRLTPGTSMPQFFLELKDADREKKIDELWAALVHQARLPLPAGVIETPADGTRIIVRDAPVIFRVATFIQPKEKIDRAINVGLPGGTNFTFDAATARLRYAWKGEFINAASAWNGRGGNPVTAQGQPLFTSASGFPLRIGVPSAEPNVRFLGYFLVKKHPVFRYLVDGVEVHERIEVRDTELIRRFTIGASDKPVFFIGEKERTYSSPSGEFEEGVLKIPAGKQLDFEVRSPLTAGRAENQKPLKWIATGGAKPPKSKSGGANTSVIFENKTKRRVKLFWVGYRGQLQLYGEIDPGKTRQQNTYAKSTWLITDENDKPLGHFIAETLVARAVIPNGK